MSSLWFKIVTMSKEKNKQIMNEILTDGRIIKEGFTGVYFLVKGEKLLTSIEIHTNAGGDPEVFKAWEASQKDKEYFYNEWHSFASNKHDGIDS